MKILKSSILWIIAITVIALLPAMLTVYTLNKTVLEPYSWNTYMSESGAYVELETRVKRHLSDAESESYQSVGSMSTETKALWFREAVEEAVNETVTVAWLEDHFDELQTAIWDYMVGEADTIESIEFNRLTENIKQKVLARVDELETATPEEKAAIRADMEARMASFQAELDVMQAVSMEEDELLTVRQTYEMLDYAFVFFVLLMGALWIAGAATAFYPSVIVKWSGWTLFISSLFIGVMWAAVKLLQLAQHLIPTGWAPESVPLDAIKDTGFQLINEMMKEVSGPIIITAIIMFVLSIILLPSSHLSILAKWDDKIKEKVQDKPYIVGIRTGVAVLVLLTVFIYGMVSGVVQI